MHIAIQSLENIMIVMFTESYIILYIVCFENTITGDVSSCNEGICTCKDGYLPPDCCQCNTDTHYGNGTVCKRKYT